MSGFSDYPDDMTTNRTLDERAIEVILAGRSPYDREDLTALASLMAELRAVGDGAPPKPTAALASILAHGLPADPTTADDLPEVAGDQLVRPAKRAFGLPTWERVRTMTSGFISAFTAKVAALGLAAKASIVLTATAAVAAGAVATDVPQTVSNTLGGGAQVPASVEVDADADAGASVEAEAGADTSDIELPDESTAVEAGEDTLDTLESTVDDSPVGGAASDAVDQADDIIGDVPDQVPGEVTDTLDDVQGQVPGEVTDTLDDVQGQVPDEVTDTADRVGSRLPSGVTDTASGLLP